MLPFLHLQKSVLDQDFPYYQLVMQNVPDNSPNDIHTTFFIKKKEWKKTIRKAIDYAIKEEKGG